MKYIIVALKDTAVQAFMPPQAVVHVAQMVRALGDGLKNKENKADYARHPEDFELYKLGEFDDAAGIVYPVNGPAELIVRLKDLV